ncbi:MAG: hypothetical protein H7844_14985 [Nitrospirae bacterium YQR-1]
MKTKLKDSTSLNTANPDITSNTIRAIKREDFVNAFILLVLAFVIVLRAPVLLTNPSFFSEEGLAYFKYAYENSFIKSLFVVQPDRGYFEIFTNVAMAMASVVPLKYAPHVSATMAFCAQLIPLAVVLWGRSFFFDNYIKKIVTLLIIIFIISTGQIWITARHSQFFFLLVTFLILIADVQGETKLKVWIYRLLVLTGGLAGVTSCYLTPVYVYRAVAGKCREYIIQAAILIFTSLLQIAVILHSYYTTGFSQRFNDNDFLKICLVYFVEYYLQPVFGYDLVLVILRNLIFVFPVAIFFVWMIYKSILDVNRRALVVGIIFSSIMLTLTSLDMTGGTRYMYAPGVMLIVLVFSYVQFNKKTFLKVSSIAAFALTVTALTTSMIEYKLRMKIYVNAKWPDWKAEVAIWEKDENHPIKIWPQLDDYKPEIKLTRQKGK